VLRRIKEVRFAGHVARMGELRNSQNISVGKSEGKRPLGRPGRRREHNSRLDLREIMWKVVDWMHLAGERDLLVALVNKVMNHRVP